MGTEESSDSFCSLGKGPGWGTMIDVGAGVELEQQLGLAGMDSSCMMGAIPGLSVPGCAHETSSGDVINS